MAYQHGITVLEQATSLTAPIEGDSAIQVVFGTAPLTRPSSHTATQRR